MMVAKILHKIQEEDVISIIVPVGRADELREELEDTTSVDFITDASGQVIEIEDVQVEYRDVAEVIFI